MNIVKKIDFFHLKTLALKKVTAQLIKCYAYLTSYIKHLTVVGTWPWFFLDISKAFDRVWHRGLLYKLQCFGVGGALLKWIEDYITHRSQKVVLNGQEPALMYTNAEVPQGSILGPLLFLIFINDIEMCIKSEMFIFADDRTLAKIYDLQREAK